MGGLDIGVALPLIGVTAGAVLGFLARRNRFCTLLSLERHWHAGDSTGLRTWILAAGIAMIATQALVQAGAIDLRDTIYLAPSLSLGGAVIGGVMFGVDMSLVGTCGFGALVRLGGGNLRSLVVLVALGLAALATQHGVMTPLKTALAGFTTIDLSFAGDQTMGSLASAALGVDVRMAVAALAAAALLTWVFADPAYRRNGTQILTGTAIGSIIAFGWLATSHAARHSFLPTDIESTSFVAPVGATILQAIATTGDPPGYGIGLVIGVVLGALLAAWVGQDSRLEACDDARELGRHLLGGAMMGIGGVLAVGCTIGQGVTAFSAMAVSAPVVLASIALGARLGLSWLIEGSVMAAFRRTGPKRETLP